MQLIDTFDRGAGYGLAEPCFIEPGGRTLSYGQVQDMSHRIANGPSAAGPDRDSKVGTLSANHLLTFPATLGIVRLATCGCPSTRATPPRKNANILRRGGCEFLFIHSQFAAQLPGLLQALPGLKGVVCIDGALPRAFAARLDGAAVRRTGPVAMRGSTTSSPSAAPAAPPGCPRAAGHAPQLPGAAGELVRRHARARTARAPGRALLCMRRVRPPLPPSLRRVT